MLWAVYVLASLGCVGLVLKGSQTRCSRHQSWPCSTALNLVGKSFQSRIDLQASNVCALGSVTYRLQHSTASFAAALWHEGNKVIRQTSARGGIPKGTHIVRGAVNKN